ncbi:protein LIFEGUARD 1-like [Pistacia vera]|uniref:protein LIFEGUARD 1-like n=1 Tax=Pistacia vera TaxID=55513 RepID=UPI001263CBE5|nr:protein LIFEGUARD 1-like [Pistacia vera]
MEKGGDIESGNCNNKELYPGMSESPELRWAFIRKVYAIISMQFLLTSAVASVVVFVKPIPHFFTNTALGLVVYILIVVLALIMLYPLSTYRKHHPWNFLLLIIFTVDLSFAVGVSCSFSKGRIILEAAILTSAMVVSLTLYTFWAVRRGNDFSFLGPFLFASLLMLIVFTLLQIFFPLGKLAHMILGCLASIIFCGYIIYDTCNLIKRYTYDEYIIAAVDIYLDIINLFLALLSVLDDV